MRVALGIALQLVIGTAVTLLLGFLVMVVTGATVATAVGDTISYVLIFVDIALVTWFALLVVGGIRRRGIGWGVRGSLAAAALGALMNLVWIVLLSLINGGLDLAAITLGVRAGVYLLLAVAVTAPLVLRVLVKTSAPAAPRP